MVYMKKEDVNLYRGCTWLGNTQHFCLFFAVICFDSVFIVQLVILNGERKLGWVYVRVCVRSGELRDFG